MYDWIHIDWQTSRWIGQAFLHFLWQGSAVLLLSMLVTSLLRTADARLRYAVQYALLLALAACPLVTLIVTSPDISPVTTPDISPVKLSRDDSAAVINATSPISHYSIKNSPRLRAIDDIRASQNSRLPSEATVDEDFAPDENLAASSSTETVANRASQTTPRFVRPLVIAYFVGVFLCLLRILFSLGNGVRLCRLATVVGDSHIVEIVRQAAAQVKLAAVPVLGVCDDILVPTVVGIIRPMVLVPASALSGLSHQQLEVIFIHELIHIKRLDPVAQLVQCLIESLLYFHPAVWLISRRIRIEREFCCDQRVIELSQTLDNAIGNTGGKTVSKNKTEHKTFYAGTLVAVAEMAQQARDQKIAARKTQQLAIASVGKRSQLRDRIEAMLRPPSASLRPARTWTSLAWMLVACVVIVLAVPTILPTLLPNSTSPTSTATSTGTATAQPAEQAQDIAKGLSLTVVDEQNQQPLPGVKIRFSSRNARDTDSVVEITETDANGFVFLPVKETPGRSFQFTADDGIHAPITGSWYDRTDGLANIPTVLKIQLPAAQSIGGLIVDSDGTAVEGALVDIGFAQKIGGALNSWTPGATRVVSTDATGRWSFPNVPVKWDSAHISVSHPTRDGTSEGEPVRERWPAGSSIEALQSRQHVLSLRPSRVVHGSIVDELGNPVQDAMIRIDVRLYPSSVPERSLDSSGVFALGVAPDAKISLSVRAPGRSPELIEVINLKDAKPLRVTLMPGKTLRGRVVNSQSEPIANATLRMDTWRGTRTLENSFRTNAAGEFEWNDAPADKMTITAYHPDYVQTKKELVASDEPIVFALRKPLKFSGTVIDKETRQPVTTFTALIGIGLSNSGDEDLPLLWGDPNWRETEEVSADGTFQKTLRQMYARNGVRVRAKGYADVISHEFTSESPDHSYVFEMSKSVGVVGRVVDENRQPVARVNVAVIARHMPESFVNDDITNFQRSAVLTTTDDSGRFTISDPNEDFSLIAWGDEGVGRLGIGEFSPGQDVTLLRWGKLTGRIMEDGKPVAGERLDGRRPFDSDLFLPEGIIDPLQLNLTVQETDSDGRFVIERVPPGRWQFGRNISLGGGGGLEGTKINVTIRPGETRDINFGESGARVMGQVSFPAGLDPNAYNFKKVTLFVDESVFYGWPAPKFADWKLMSVDDRQAYFRNLEEKTPQGVKSYNGKINATGSFVVYGVPPGTYKARVQIVKSASDRFDFSAIRSLETRIVVPHGAKEVTVPEFEFNPNPPSENVVPVVPEKEPATKPATKPAANVTTQKVR